MTAQVFISHSTKDAGAAEVIRDGLKAVNISCWYAKDEVKPGQNYHETLMMAIGGCPIVLLILSGASNSSIDVLSEISHTDNCRKNIVVVVLDGAVPSRELRPLLVGCDRVEVSTSAVEDRLPPIRHCVRAALTRSAVASKSKTTAILASIIPGCGLLYLGFKWPGGSLFVAATGAFGWAYFLELGTPLDRFLGAVFLVLLFLSIGVTVHTVLGSATGSGSRSKRWIPYLASIVVPAAGATYAGRRRTGWTLYAFSAVALILVMCSGEALTFSGLPLDGLALDVFWLLGFAESGFTDDAGHHRSPFLYSAVLLFLGAMLFFCAKGLI